MICCKCNLEFDDGDIRKLGRCNHVCCCKCLIEHFENFLEPKIKCISSGCDRFISDKVIRECLTDDQTNLYEQLSILGCSQKAAKCLTDQCTYLVIYEGENIVFECEYCGAPNCTKCKKRHYINDCGRNTADADAIESRARDTLKGKHRRDFEELRTKHRLIPNPDSFECVICGEFILPRVGFILRNCLHSFCKDCLFGLIKAKEHIGNMVCSHTGCGVSLDLGEISELMKDELSKMMIKEAQLRFFQCKNGDCPGIWDVGNSKEGFVKCPKCGKVNCVACQDIHEGMKCAEFRDEDRYKAALEMQKVLDKEEHVKCHLCLQVLIQKGGCGAMYCNNCGSHTCIFTGKIAGPHDSITCYCKGGPNCTKVQYYCGCTHMAPCVPKCMYGCIPEVPH